MKQKYFMIIDTRNNQVICITAAANANNALQLTCLHTWLQYPITHMRAKEIEQ